MFIAEIAPNVENTGTLRWLVKKGDAAAGVEDLMSTSATGWNC